MLASLLPFAAAGVDWYCRSTASSLNLKTGSVLARYERQFVDGSRGSFQGAASGYKQAPS